VKFARDADVFPEGIGFFADFVFPRRAIWDFPYRGDGTRCRGGGAIMDFPYRGRRIPLPREALRDRWRSLNNPTTKRGSDPLLDFPGLRMTHFGFEDPCVSFRLALTAGGGDGFQLAETVCEQNKCCFAYSLREFLLTAGGGSIVG